MLTLPDFELLRPATVDDAVAMLAEHGADARLVAGGTDILVNMKHGITTPSVLVDLSAVAGLREVVQKDDEVVVGAMVTLTELAESALIAARYPSLSEAAGLVAGPQLRNMGTIGGNVCLDTRCVYINQTHFWRQSLGYCLKRDGEVCHVVKNGRRCVAAQSSDSVPVLISLDARARLVSSAGAREVAVEALYKRDGVAHLALEPGEVLTHVVLPQPRRGLRSAYQKLRVRKSIDFPALSVAAAVALDDDGLVEHIAIVGTALMATPRRLGGVDKIAIGKALDDAVIDQLAQRAFKQFVPMTNILVDPEWRREMVPVFVKRALKGLKASR